MASADDPHEVLKACLEFQKSSPASTQRQLFRSTSSTKCSWYPSAEETNILTGDFNSEINWQNAAVAKKSKASVNIQSNIMTDIVDDGSSSTKEASNDGENEDGRLSRRLEINASDTASAAATVATITSTRVEADATIIDSGALFHPLEFESAVQAEPICQEGNDHGRQDVQSHDHDDQELTIFADRHESVAESQCDNTGNVLPVVGQSNENDLPTEATVIESGDPEKATIDAWSGQTTEAVVMTQENGSNSTCSPSQVDAKFNEECQNQRIDTGSRLGIENNMSAATIVNYSSHDSEATDQSVRAEYMGSAPTSTIVTDEVDSTSIVETAFERHDAEQAQEATVLDCGPSEKATVAAWSGETEVHVLEDSCNRMVEINADDGEKGASSSTSTQLEIIEITEDAHPAEIESELSTTAQLISNNPNETCNQVNATSTAENQTIYEPNLLQDTQSTKQRNNMMEIISGKKSFQIESFPSRELLPSSITYNETQDSWMISLTILDTQNERESLQSVRAFSASTEEQAMCIRQTLSPPVMHPVEFSTECCICRVEFYPVMPCHCRNCGFCICNSCAVQWPSKMLPETYNVKNDDFVKVCKGCDWLCSTFRRALQEGDFNKAIDCYMTRNINLTTPFANIKGEVFYPIHCAVEGRSLPLLRWLVDVNHCPLYVDSVGRKSKDDTSLLTPILTSNSRGLVSIALANDSIDILRYLVVEKGTKLENEKNLPIDKLIQNFDSVLRILPL